MQRWEYFPDDQNGYFVNTTTTSSLLWRVVVYQRDYQLVTRRADRSLHAQHATHKLILTSRKRA